MSGHPFFAGRRVLGLSMHELALCTVTMVWGATFLVQRLAMEVCGPFFFTGLRFGSAAVILLAMSWRSMRELTHRELLAGLSVAATLFTGSVLQTAGMIWIPAGKSAFITAFYLLLIPVLQLVFMKEKPSRSSLLGMAVAFPGVMLLTVTGENGLVSLATLGPGELMTILCAVAFAGEVVVLGIVAPGCDAGRMSTVEVLAVGLLGFIATPIAGEAVPKMGFQVLACGLGLGCVSAFLQAAMTWGQKEVDPSRAGVIYSAEPVWGGFFGFLAGERLGAGALVGAALVLGGVLLATRPGKRTPEGTVEEANGGPRT